MKKKLVLLFIVLAAISFNSNAQKNANVIKLTPFTFLKGQMFMLHYERNLFSKMSVGIGIAPVFTGPIFSLGTLSYIPNPSSYNLGIAIDPEIRWYAKSNDVMDGFFIGFYNSNRYSSWESTTEGVNVTELFSETANFSSPFTVQVKNQKHIFGLQLGVQKMMSDHISIDFYSGLGFNGNKTTATGTREDGTIYKDEIPGAGINLRLNLAVGYRF